MAYNACLPSGLEPPAVLHRGAEGGGVESAQVGEKAEEKSLVRWEVGFRLSIIAVRSLAGYLRLPERDRRWSLTF